MPDRTQYLNNSIRITSTHMSTKRLSGKNNTHFSIHLMRWILSWGLLTLVACIGLRFASKRRATRLFLCIRFDSAVPMGWLRLVLKGILLLVVLSKSRNTADNAFSSRPLGAPQKLQSCVAAFVKGATINCTLRLDLNLL